MDTEWVSYVDRRAFLSSAAALSLAVGSNLHPRAARAEAVQDEACGASSGWRRFEVATRVALLDAPGAAQLWLPLAQTAGGYQAGSDAAGDAPKTAKIVQVVATRDRDGADPVPPITGAGRQFWTQPTESLPTAGVVGATASRITAGISEPRARLRAIYDWVVDHTNTSSS